MDVYANLRIIASYDAQRGGVRRAEHSVRCTHGASGTTAKLGVTFWHERNKVVFAYTLKHEKRGRSVAAVCD